MKKIPVYFLAVMAVLCCHIACKRNGTGGEAEISVYVKHHGNLIPGATVYIKYGSKDFPGADPGLYDASVLCGTIGAERGHAKFTELLKGNYYLYGVGYDSTIMAAVKGGLYIKISKKREKKETDLPVTE